MLQFNKEIGLKSWIVDFWDESDKGGIDTLQIYSALKELMTELIEILFDHIPTLFHKETIETIRARGFVRGH